MRTLNRLPKSHHRPAQGNPNSGQAVLKASIFTPSYAQRMTRVSSRLRPFGTTIFAEMTALAKDFNAINLSQGFPDTQGPASLLDAAARAIRERDNQYAPLPGLPSLRNAIATSWADAGNRNPDPDTEITVTAGCTEAIAATLLGILEPGDEVILFEPFYDSYRACVALADAKPKFVQIRPGGGGDEARFGFCPDELKAAFSDKTKAVLVNTPHNPTGIIFTPQELTQIAALCIQHDCIAISDEVYEHLVLETPQSASHHSIAALPGMAERTITLSSLGKSYSVTGWKIGWAIAPPDLTTAIRSAHQFLTYAIATPLQHAAAFALTDQSCLAWRREWCKALSTNRDLLCRELTAIGFRCFSPEAGYFVMADHTAISQSLGLSDDASLVRAMTQHAGVAAIPPSAFCVDQELCKPFVRFAFCKQPDVLQDAVARLQAWVGVSSK